MKLRSALPALVAAFALAACSDSPLPVEPSSSGAGLGPSAHSSELVTPASHSPLHLPITGTIGTETVFEGFFTVERFVVRQGQLFARGTLEGVLTIGETVQQISQTILLPVTSARGSCQILELTLGPLDLDLLGLVVELDEVHLTITAEQGSGRLLGNLLCAVARLLDTRGPLSSIADLLNQIIRLL